LVIPKIAKRKSSKNGTKTQPPTMAETKQRQQPQQQPLEVSWNLVTKVRTQRRLEIIIPMLIQMSTVLFILGTIIIIPFMVIININIRYFKKIYQDFFFEIK
jgi:hypothetical protein